MRTAAKSHKQLMKDVKKVVESEIDATEKVEQLQAKLVALVCLTKHSLSTTCALLTPCVRTDRGEQEDGGEPNRDHPQAGEIQQGERNRCVGVRTSLWHTCPGLTTLLCECLR